MLYNFNYNWENMESLCSFILSRVRDISSGSLGFLFKHMLKLILAYTPHTKESC